MRQKTQTIVMKPAAAALVLVCLVFWTAQGPSAEPDQPGISQPASRQGHRSREGSVLTEERGSFEVAGERVLFVPAGAKDSYRVLENLALERIIGELEVAREQKTWAVSGQLTEFKGANYLLVTKALLQAATAPAALPASKPAPAAALPETGREVANRAGLR